MDTLDPMTPRLVPTAQRPLLGMTVLVVEDSRYASEALRLLCLRSGARIRRADCLRSARRHLQVYRPSVVVVDLGLPDGSGLDLIDELNRAAPRVGAIVAISGDDAARNRSLAAGADCFLTKPVLQLSQFQRAIQDALPGEMRAGGIALVSEDVVEPDPLALRDDMTHAATLLDAPQSEAVLNYVCQFLGSVARLADDRALESAAAELLNTRVSGGAYPARVARLAGLVHSRLHERVVI